MLQVEALEILKTGASVFLTGVPGAGKTYVINQYIKYLEDHGVYPSITATTGIAATHVGGSTIHSFTGIGIEKDIDDYKIEKIMEREKLVKKIQNTKVLIIDEISMLDAQTLDNVNKVLKAIKDPTKAFGGIQIIFVGDFFQLPPIIKQGEATKFFAFMGNSWKEARPLTCYLEEQFRQTDEVFTKLLLAIRENSIDEMHVEILEDLKKNTYKKLGLVPPLFKGGEGDFFEEESVELDPEHKSPQSSLNKGGGNTQEQNLDILELHSHNKNVDEINNTKLGLIKGKEFTYKMITVGRAQLVEALIRNCLSPEILKLKVGAKVIFTKNSMEGEYVNGTMGKVAELESFRIVVQTSEGKMIDVKQEEWKIEEDGKVKARLSQYPLRLAWAITVHKSQGMSLDEAIISLGETFEYGQGYVALSRVRTLEGLYLKSYNPKSLQVNAAISEFDEKIRKDSRFIQNKFLKADGEKLLKTQNQFIEKCGGVVEGNVPQKVYVPRKNTYEITLDLIRSGKTYEEIMTERDASAGTIMSHIEHLYEKKKVEKKDLEKVATVNIYNIPNEVKKSFKKNQFKVDEEKMIKLTPVFKELKEKYSFADLRWYRLVIEL
jgi:hypothetical protein